MAMTIIGILALIATLVVVFMKKDALFNRSRNDDDYDDDYASGDDD